PHRGLHQPTSWPWLPPPTTLGWVVLQAVLQWMLPRPAPVRALPKLHLVRVPLLGRLAPHSLLQRRAQQLAPAPTLERQVPCPAIGLTRNPADSVAPRTGWRAFGWATRTAPQSWRA